MKGRKEGETKMEAERRRTREQRKEGRRDGEVDKCSKVDKEWKGRRKRRERK